MFLPLQCHTESLHWPKNLPHFTYLSFSPSLRTPGNCWSSYGFHSFVFLRNVTSVQFSCSVMSDSVIPWTAACQASLSMTNSWSLLKLMSIKLVMPSNHLILCRPFLLLPSIFPSVIFQWVSSLDHVAKVLAFQLQHNSPSKVCSELISFRIDWSDLLAVQGTLKSPLQHPSSKASVLQCSAAGSQHTRSHPWQGHEEKA